MGIADAFSIIYQLAFKADVPPDWFSDSQRLAALIQGEWDKLTSEYLFQLQDAIRLQDWTRVDELIGSLKGFDFNLSDSGRNQLEQTLNGIQNRAIAAYTLHGVNDGLLSRIKHFDGDYQKFLNEAHADQIQAFVRANPGRILHPEIERQVGYIRDTAEGRFIDTTQIAERMQRAIKQEEYWKGLSDVQVARLWHHDGVKLADENNISVLYVSGPDDVRTCPVCKAMLGQRLEVKRVLKRFEDHANITDPDEYVKAWPFPRFMDIDNMSNEERVEKTGHMPPPYHPHCRHGVSWLTEARTVQERTIEAEPSHYPLKMRPIDKLLVKPPTLKEALADWKNSGEWNYHTLETVPLSDIQIPTAWHEKRLTSAAAGVETKAPMPPVQLSEDVVPGRKLKIVDGIHRTNASLQAGLTEVPAIVSRMDTAEPTAERLKELRRLNRDSEKQIVAEH